MQVFFQEMLSIPEVKDKIATLNLAKTSIGIEPEFFQLDFSPILEDKAMAPLYQILSALKFKKKSQRFFKKAIGLLVS